jgi:hypothetical protein
MFADTKVLTDTFVQWARLAFSGLIAPSASLTSCQRHRSHRVNVHQISKLIEVARDIPALAAA